MELYPKKIGISAWTTWKSEFHVYFPLFFSFITVFFFFSSSLTTCRRVGSEGGGGKREESDEVCDILSLQPNQYIYHMAAMSTLKKRVSICTCYYHTLSFIRIHADLTAELDAGIETERELIRFRNSETAPNGSPREFQNSAWRNPVTPNQLLSTEVSLEMNTDTKDKIKAEKHNRHSCLDNRLAQKSHLHITVFIIVLVFHIYISLC